MVIADSGIMIADSGVIARTPGAGPLIGAADLFRLLLDLALASGLWVQGQEALPGGLAALVVTDDLSLLRLGLMSRSQCPLSCLGQQRSSRTLARERSTLPRTRSTPQSLVPTCSGDLKARALR